MNTVITTFSALRNIEAQLEVTSSVGDSTMTRNLLRERNRLREELSNLITQEKLGRLY
jgi:hypothetical protein